MTVTHQHDRTAEIGPIEFEAIGVDRIPEEQRTAAPRHMGAILIGSDLSLGVILFGWLPVTLGLGFWSSVSSLAVGTVIGLVVVTPLILIGSRTATNNSTASGAHFGVRGRLIGSVIGLLIMLMYTALAAWTAGDAAVGSLHRLFGTPQSDLVVSLGYAGAMVFILLVALYGFHLLARVETALVVVSGLLLTVLTVAVAPDMDLGYKGGDYLLGSFGTTWALSAVAFGVSGPLAFMLQLGDYTRYISSARHSSRRIVAVGWFGIGFGALGMAILGTAFATAFADPFEAFVAGLVGASPEWAAPIVLALGVLGAVGLGATTVYSSGLDLDAILPWLTRLQATVVVGIGSVALVFLGALVFEAEDSITAMTVMLVAIGTPWAMIVGIGFLTCRGRYLLDDLQVFNRRQRGGAYWFTGGWNVRAAVAWLAGATFGLLAVNTTLYTGPLADIADGIDISFLGAGAIAGILYLVLGALFPVHRTAREPVGVVEDPAPAVPELGGRG